jgi:hypothetical protein
VLASWSTSTTMSGSPRPVGQHHRQIHQHMPWSCRPARGRIPSTATENSVVSPIGDPPGPTVPPYAARRRFARGWSVHSGRYRGRRVPTPCHFQRIAHRGACGKTRVVPQNRGARPGPAEAGVAECVCCCRRMGRAGASNRWWDSRCGCGSSARRCGCARRRTAQRLAEVGVPLVPAGPPVAGATPPSAVDVPRRVAELVAAQFDTVAPAAEGCDALVATGLMPAAAGARSVAEELGIRSVYASYCPIFLPSPHHPPSPRAAPAVPTGRDRQPGAVGPGRPERKRAVRTTLTAGTRARAAAVAGTIRTDGATVAATLLLDAVSRVRPPVSGWTTRGPRARGKCPTPGCAASAAGPV